MQNLRPRIAHHPAAKALAFVVVLVPFGNGKADGVLNHSVFAPVAQNEVAPQDEAVSHDKAVSQEIDAWISRLDDDRALTRSEASERIVRLAQRTNQRQRQSLIQSLLRTGLVSDLDLQMRINRLIEQIREDEFASTIAEFLDHSTCSDERLRSGWQHFAARALNRSDSREVFARVALQAGPSLNWQSINHRRPTQPEPTVLVSHLGCVAPIHPRFFLPESQVIYAKLVANRHQSIAPNVATKDDRVLGRLLDATVLNNPYGWTVEQRLHLALVYQRDAVAIKIADGIMRSSDRSPIDWTASMLAVRQVEQRSGWIDSGETTDLPSAWSTRIQSINDSLDDSRTLAVKPAGRPVPIIHKNPNRVIGQPNLFQSGIIRTRVQDVAAWILLDRSNRDPRRHGMPQLEADSVWGVHRASVGFATDYDRSLAIAAAKL